MDTKAIILKTALELYNELGVNTVSSRHIAAKMGISPGNLHYHFKHTDDIIQMLYNHLAVKFDAIISTLESNEEISFDVFREQSKSSFELVYEYRFIFLHFVEIGMRIPSVRNDYYALTQRRKNEFVSVFNQLIAKGIFRDDLPESIMENLVTQIFIVGDFWLSNNELTLKLKGNDAVEHYSNVFFNMFYPYLTSVAKENLIL
ncbi:TetR/AcrR family transcriptional regulator [Flavobacterium sp. '19STA2R22 D10 B1']|uniref:TetR/AcrR family transcriptional regulator n=1 Tax=Flavobacterium aerium TaxID=3037261 RepID=UPI00278BCB61|nr:TetR/AcrR family transcriptional regulator [Flavobacterium sp. '19STA2R22 D10 B1']